MTKIFVNEKAGFVSTELLTPVGLRGWMVLSHGAGAGMHHTFMKRLAESLSESGIGTLRFNFPYIEKGKKIPDHSSTAIQTVAAVTRWAKENLSNAPLILGGKSFGGRMASHFLAQEKPEYVAGMVFFGFPLHPDGKPGVERAAHLPMVNVPMLFLQGTRDSLAQLDLVQSVCKPLTGATLSLLEGADHGFRAGRATLESELAQRTASWFNALRAQG